jgi:hypothetical protein
VLWLAEWPIPSSHVIAIRDRNKRIKKLRVIAKNLPLNALQTFDLEEFPFGDPSSRHMILKLPPRIFLPD